jgi:hypothetical protein
MEADKLISSIEKYVREFILYLMSFFWAGKSDSENDPILETLNKTFVFAIISALAGAYLWNRYIYGNNGSVHDLAGLLTDTLLKWFSYGLLLYGLMRLSGTRPHILLPLLAVFKVFSVAHIVAIFGSYFTKNALWMFSPNGEYLKFGSANAAKVAYFLQFLLIALYIPREISNIVGSKTRRIAILLIVTVFLVTTGFVSYANYLDPLAGIKATETIAGLVKPSKGR